MIWRIYISMYFLQNMGGLSKAAESLPEGFGYVIFAYVGNEFVNMWMAINVGRARKQYEVEVSTGL